MFGHELAVEQGVAADLEPGDQPGKRHLGGIGAQREHAFAEEGCAEADTVQPADQLALLPDFDRMGVAEAVELGEAPFNLKVDPGLVAFRAAADYLAERAIQGDFERAGPQRFAKRA